jgi:hypothetical protein
VQLRYERQNNIESARRNRCEEENLAMWAEMLDASETVCITILVASLHETAILLALKGFTTGSPYELLWRIDIRAAGVVCEPRLKAHGQRIRHWRIL